MADTKQLLAGVRAKYPGAYDNTPDDVLLSGVKKKFPGAYDSYNLETTKNPFQEALSTTGEVLSGGFKRQMATGPTSFNTITGGPATEFGHGVKTEAMVRAGVPEIVAESASGATDPQVIMGAGLTRVGQSLTSRFPEALKRLQAMRTSAKGRATVSRLLPAGKLSEDVEAGRPSGLQVEGFNLIKKTKNPQDIVDKFRNERSKVISQVDEYVEQNNKPVSSENIRNRAESLLKKQFENSSDDEITSLNESISEELNHMPRDTKSANSRKRFLYEKTQNLQKAQRQGKTTVTRPEQSLVEDAFARAYKEAIEEAHPDIAPTNQRFGGLDEGVKAASKLVEGEVERTPSGEKIASQTIGRPSVGSMLAALVREIPFIGSSPRVLSGLIQKLNIKHGNLLSQARKGQAPRIIGKQFFEPKQSPASLPYEPYGGKMPYKGGAGNYSGPEVIYKPPPPDPFAYSGGAGKTTPPTYPEYTPYGDKGLKYKDPGPMRETGKKMKDLAKRRKRA